MLSSPPKVEAAFFLYDANKYFSEDNSLVFCLNRPLFSPEKTGYQINYTFNYRIDLKDGGQYKNEDYRLNSFYVSRTFRDKNWELYKKLNGRCFIIREPQSGSRDRSLFFNVDKDFNINNIENFYFKISYEGLYEKRVIHTYSKTPELYKIPYSDKYLEGRQDGILFSLLKECPKLTANRNIITPSEISKNDYAEGFKSGFNTGNFFIRNQRRPCYGALRLYGPEGYNTKNALNTKK